MSYIERYKKGEYSKVWNESYRLGGSIRSELLFYEAEEVAHETMFRVRENAQVVFERLNELDYQFQYPELAFNLPDQNLLNTLKELESQGGLLPLSLQVFYKQVGSIWFLGAHPALSECLEVNSDIELGGYADPIAVAPLVYRTLMDYQTRVSFDVDNIDNDGLLLKPYSVYIGPDEVSKAGYSGGGPYEIFFPEPAVDATLRYWNEKVTFVQYLRICFKWGGFPGFRYSMVPPKKELAFLTKDLLPF